MHTHVIVLSVAFAVASGVHIRDKSVQVCYDACVGMVMILIFLCNA